ncbi:hypothetical protein BDV19DRAFT_353454 [Aspergillus venezuelensis]
MTTSLSSVLRLHVLAHFFLIVALVLALRTTAFDPLGIFYEVAGAGPRLVRREGTLGGSTPAITETGDSERPYAVDGNTFTDYTSAAQRSCNLQYDICQLAANTDESVTFTLDDCQDQQNDCIADPPAVSDGSSSMSVASSDDTSDSTDSSDSDSDSSSDDADSDATESDEDSSESSAASGIASTASIASTENTDDGEDTKDNSQTTSNDDSETSDTDTTDSADAESEAESATLSDTTESQSDAAEADSTTASTTEAKQTLVVQTTIPYDAEFDLVCDF